MSSARALATLLLILAALWTCASGAAADEVSSERFGDLVGTAPADPAAAAELETVTSVEGRPVDPRRALDAPEPERTERLAELGRAFDPAAVARDGAALSQRAGELAAEPAPPVEAEENGESTGSGSAPTFGVSAPVAIALVLATLLIAALLANRVAGGALPAAREPSFEGSEAEAADSVRELERRAERAAAEGDLAGALRLRFRAGLLRLSEAGLIELRRSMTAREVTRAVPSERVGALTSTFERVAYGGAQASPGDLEVARSGWPEAVAEAKRGARR